MTRKETFARNLGLQLATQRKRACLTQVDLGAALGMSQVWVSNMEGGHHVNASHYNVRRFLGACGVVAVNLRILDGEMRCE